MCRASQLYKEQARINILSCFCFFACFFLALALSIFERPDHRPSM